MIAPGGNSRSGVPAIAKALVRRPAIRSGEESVFCPTALLRRGFNSADFLDKLLVHATQGVRRFPSSRPKTIYSTGSPKPTESQMPTPEIAARTPFAINVEKGKDYYWCSCGKSKTQPFCDGSHKGSEFAPTKYTAEESKTVYFCGCKHSANGALCDGTHKSL